MRILMTADTVGGVFTYAVELMRALGERDVEVVLATLGRPLDPEQRRELHSLPPFDLYESTYALEWMPDPWADVAASSVWLQELTARVQPDCLHFNHFAHAEEPWPVPALVVGHSCMYSWWHAVHGEPLSRQRNERYYQAVRASVRRADAVVAPSTVMLDSLIRHYGSPVYSEVVPNGIDLERFVPRSKQPFVLSAGRLWDEGKNIAALERVARDLDWPVYVAGPQHAPAKGIGARFTPTSVRALGPLARPALARCLGHASIYALPARYEPFGLSVLEAAASGCALVLGRIPSLLENWDGAATFVDPDNGDELRDALARLIADPALRLRLSAAAKQRARSFSAKRMARGYANLYRSLVPARGDKGLSCAS